MEDKELLAGLREGSTEALELIIGRYGGYVKSVIARRLWGKAEKEDVEELVLNTFVTLWKARKTIKGERLAGWLAAVARNEAAGYLRRKRLPGGSEEEYLAAADASAEAAYKEKELKILLDDALEALGEEDKRILLRFHYDGAAVDEIAEELKMNPETVKSRLRRSRARLKTTLLERGYELED